MHARREAIDEPAAPPATPPAMPAAIVPIAEMKLLIEEYPTNMIGIADAKTAADAAKLAARPQQRRRRRPQ